MTTQSPSGHDPEETAKTMLELADSLLALSRELLTCSTKPELPQLGQMITRRGLLLAELTRHDAGKLQAGNRTLLHEKLDMCRKMDETIEQNLKTQRSGFEEQLRAMKDARTLMDKYRAGGQTGIGTRQAEA